MGYVADADVPVIGDPFPVVSSLLAPEALLTEVAHAYALDTLISCRLLRAYVNDVYLLTTASDAYVLKVYRAHWRSRSEIAYELDVLSHLAATGIPTAPARRRRDGTLIGALRAAEGTRYGVLFAFAEGAKPTPPFTAALYYHFGQATARMHRALDGFASAHARVPLDLAYLIDQPLAALRPRLKRRPDDWAFLVRLADKVRARVTALGAVGLDWGVCHGDLSLDNVHVTDGDRFTFYDFDSGGPGWRACEPYGVLQYRPHDNWEAFLEGYRASKRFGPVEVAAVPYFAAAMGIWGMGNRVRNWTAWSGLWLADDTYFDEQMAQWRQWDAEWLGES